MKPAAAVWIGAIALPLGLLSCGGSDETAIRVVASYNQSRGFDQLVFALATSGNETAPITLQSFPGELATVEALGFFAG